MCSFIEAGKALGTITDTRRINNMRYFLLAVALLVSAPLLGQAPIPSVPSPISIQAALNQALVGDWVGVLEYRDYSEPPTSTKRVQLPTWLRIVGNGQSLQWHYIYDDGPNKVVDETDTVIFDTSASTYSEAANGKPPMVYKVTGYESLKDGRGVLFLAGTGTDNDKPSETRVTITIRRNLLEILEETRPAGSDVPMAFRHAFRFTRAVAPAVTAPLH
jgi:hypothetical protein